MQNETDENERPTLTRVNSLRQNQANSNHEEVVDRAGTVTNSETDAGEVSLWNIFWIFVSILIHSGDIGTDIYVASCYWMAEQRTYFTLTAAFVLIPSLVNIMMSIRMYQQDHEKSSSNEEKTKYPTCGSRLVQNPVLWPLICILQMAPLLRYIDAAIYAIKSFNFRRKGNQVKQQEKYYRKWLKEEQDVALLRVFECFLEAAPQLVLQLTIMLSDYRANPSMPVSWFPQGPSIVSSFIGMGWAMRSYHRNIRKAQRDKQNISFEGNCLQFTWHFLITISRVVTIVAAATILPTPGIVLWLFIHWGIMMAWMARVAPSGIMQFCCDGTEWRYPSLGEKVKTFLFASTCGLIYIFTYLKFNDGPTYWSHTFYYTLCSVENVAAAMIWSLERDPSITLLWFYEFIPKLCIIPFLLGICVMIIYYKSFHPNMKLITIDQQPQDANDPNLPMQ